jgi:hypothetical protein
VNVRVSFLFDATHIYDTIQVEQWSFSSLNVADDISGYSDARAGSA